MIEKKIKYKNINYSPKKLFILIKYINKYNILNNIIKLNIFIKKFFILKNILLNINKLYINNNIKITNIIINKYKKLKKFKPLSRGRNSIINKNKSNIILNLLINGK